MNQYMVSIRLPEKLTPEFTSLIPRQRAVVNDWVTRGTIASYSLAMDRGRLWVVVNGSSESTVMDVLSSFPLIAFMRFEIVPLMFHQYSPETLLPISWN